MTFEAFSIERDRTDQLRPSTYLEFSLPSQLDRNSVSKSLSELQQSPFSVKGLLILRGLLRYLKLPHQQIDENSILGKAITLRRQLSQLPDQVDPNLYIEIMPEIVQSYADLLNDQSIKQWVIKSVDYKVGLDKLKHDQNFAFTQRVLNNGFRKIKGDLVLNSRIKNKNNPYHFKMNASTRVEIQNVFNQLVERFDGDLMQVKEYINAYNKEAKNKFDTKKISYEEYKKILTFVSSLRGKATYNAYENFVKINMAKKAISKASGLSGFLGGKKNLSGNMQNILTTTGVGEIMLNWKKIKSESEKRKKKPVTSDEVWQNSRAFKKIYDTIEQHWFNQSKQMDVDSKKLLEEAGIDPSRFKHLKNKVVNVLPMNLREKVLLASIATASLFGDLRGVANALELQKQQQEVVAMTDSFIKEWENATSKPDYKGITQQSNKVVKGVEIKEVKSNIRNATELMKNYYENVILPERIKHLNSLSEEERLKIFEAIGGPENINNGLFTVVVMGKDTTGDRYGLDKDGQPLGRNDQTMVIMIDINSNKVNVVSIPRDIAIPRGMYGESSPLTFNGLTWIDQHHSTENGGYVGLDREIAQKVITDATGKYVDGIVEFDFQASAELINSLFPKGITIKMSDSFVPENDVLGKISGYKKGGYKSFIEGKEYKFDGEAVVALLRVRETRLGDTYSRESDAARVITQIMQEMISQFAQVNSFTELSERLNSFEQLIESTNNLESSGHLRAHFWGYDQRPTSVFKDILGQIGIDQLWEFAKAWQLKGDSVLPEFSFYSPSVSDMVAAPAYKHKVVFPSGVDKNGVSGYQWDRVKFWSYFRDKINQFIGGKH